jgi:hypothetical protein
VQRPAPYIGVSGVMTPEEVYGIMACYHASDDIPRLRDRRLMLGVLASSKTLVGGTNKYPRRYPATQDIAALFPPDRRSLNLIHYATDDQANLPRQLHSLIALGGPFLDGFQINMAWPTKNAFAKQLKGLRVVLQIGPAAQQQVRHDPETLVIALGEYDDAITDILIDGSGGKGVPMDVDAVSRYVDAVATACPHLGIGVAGGLSASRLLQLETLVTRHPFVSIDAEGRIRDANDDLDPVMTKAYVSQAMHLFSK